MSKGRIGRPERIGAVLDGLLQARGLSESIERAAVLPEWAELVGPRIAGVALPTGFDRATLFVAVRSSAWLMELEILERKILGQLNAGRNRGKFERIVFRLAEDEGAAGR